MHTFVSHFSWCNVNQLLVHSLLDFFSFSRPLYGTSRTRARFATQHIRKTYQKNSLLVIALVQQHIMREALVARAIARR
jgi:hypothetical protein